jgi:hypothetical protein
VCGSGVLVCSSSLLIRRHQRARCQAETPLIDLFKFAEPALYDFFSAKEPAAPSAGNTFWTDPARLLLLKKIKVSR